MTIVISGATGGVGAAIAEIFSSNGYDTVLLGRDMDKLDDLSEGIKSRYDTHSSYYFCDANNQKSIEDCINNTKVSQITLNLDSIKKYSKLLLCTIVTDDYDSIIFILPYFL
jgi:short-subunit dehydrogenase